MHLEGLPLFAAGHAAGSLRLEAGAGFWPAIEQLATGDAVAGQLDELLAGATSPRTWLLLHEPGEPQLSSVAALMLARALVSRGQNVLVLDIDEDEAALTRWTGRDETEGWIDVARFGASVLGAGIALPFRGGRGTLLGVGSFRPTDATEGEIVSLIGRLRHQADDIVLVGAVGPAVVPWAKLASRRVLCWDPGMRPADALAQVCRPFASSGVPLTGLLAFGDVVAPAVAEAAPDAVAAVADDATIGMTAGEDEVVDEPAEVDDSVEVDEADEVDETDEADEADEADDTGDADVDGSVDEMEPADDDMDDAAVGDDTEPAEADTDDEPLVITHRVPVPPAPAMAASAEAGRPLPPPPVIGRDADLGLGLESEAPRGTPRVFWLATGVFVVALAAVAWYWSEYVRVPPGGYFSPVATHEDSLLEQGSRVAAGQGQGAESTTAKERQVAEAGGLTSIDDTLSDVREAATPTTTGTPTTAASGPTTTPATVPATTPATAPAKTPTSTPGDAAAPARTPVTAPTPAGQAAPVAPALTPFDQAAYKAPVGQDGWALHLYSVPDSAGAVKECAGLERAGFRAAVRIVEIKEKGGRWWRIYVGSFPSKKAAQAAIPALLDKLKADWAEPAPMK